MVLKVIGAQPIHALDKCALYVIRLFSPWFLYDDRIILLVIALLLKIY